MEADVVPACDVRGPTDAAVAARAPNLYNDSRCRYVDTMMPVQSMRSPPIACGTAWHHHTRTHHPDPGIPA